MSPLRLAFCSPLPPAQSGIADYSAVLLAELESHCAEIRVFNADGAPVSTSLQRRYEVAPLSELPKWTHRDATVYQIGNEPSFHGSIYEMALREPGIVVLHEFMLQHLVRGLMVNRRRTQEYAGLMQACYGQGGGQAARRYLATGSGRDLWDYPLFEPIVDVSQGVIVHNQTARDRILRSRPETRVEVVPPPLYGDVVPVGDRLELRSELGIPASSFVVASFGLMSEAKRLEVSLAAFAKLRQRVPDALYYLVGDTSPFIGLDILLQGELGESVVATGRQDLDRFVSYMQVADVAVNLRHPFGGETSAAALRLLGLGQTVVVSNIGWLGEIPDDVAVKIAIDEREEQTLTAALWALAEEPALRAQLGANARRWALAQHAPDRVAERYTQAIQRLSACKPRRSAGWLNHALVNGSPSVQETIVGEVGEALFDLGAEESDEEILGDTAQALEDLGLA